MNYLNNTLKNKTLQLLLLMTFLLAAPMQSQAICKGKMINPVSDINWGNLFRFTILSGIKIGPGRETMLHREPAVLKCPHQAYPGVGVTFHSPDWLGEVTAEPMCVLSLPGAKLSDAFDRNRGTRSVSKTVSKEAKSPYAHIHMFGFDVMSLLEFFKTFSGCLDTVEDAQSLGNLVFAVKWISEIDITHSNPLWSIAFSPEAIVFSNPVALLACIPDTISSTFFNEPLDSFFWCQGQSGTVYPFGGHAKANVGTSLTNISLLQKHLAHGHRMFLYPSTIGPWAQCMTFPLGVITKSQYVFDPTFPVARRNGSKIYYGNMAEEWTLGRPYNTPTPNNGEDSAYIIWRARQCSIGK